MDLQDRRKALEEEFFQKENARLLQRLQQSEKTDQTKEELAQVSGIRDDALLERLTNHGVSAPALAALTLVPLIWVAWADRGINPREREAILKAAIENDIDQSGTAYELLESWLTKPPRRALYEAWTEYTRASMAELDDREATEIKADLVGRARAVAKAAGGFLGLGAVSQAERDVLAEIEAAFS